MKQIFILLAGLAMACSLQSCSHNKAGQKVADVTADTDVIKSAVLTKELQAKLSPDTVIAGLKQGNHEFINDKLTIRNNSQRVSEASTGQYPEAVILSCLDSRVPVEDVFHKGIGDLFVARVAGNIVNADILGSLEYGCKVSGAKVILVLGHESCGAIKSAIDNVKLGNITTLLEKIQPAVKIQKVKFTGKATSKDAAFVEYVCRENVVLAIDKIRAESPILKEMEQKGEIKIVGAIYHIKSGLVDFL